MHTAFRGKSETETAILILKHFLNEFFLLYQFFLKVHVHTFMIFLTKNVFDQYRRRFLFLKLGGPAKSGGCYWSQTAPHWKIIENPQKIVFLRLFLAPMQHLVGAGNHICRAPNTLKTS